MEIFPSKWKILDFFFFPGIPLPKAGGWCIPSFSRGASKRKRQLCSIQAWEELINPHPGFWDAPFPPLEANLDPHREWENRSTTPRAWSEVKPEVHWNFWQVFLHFPPPWQRNFTPFPRDSRTPIPQLCQLASQIPPEISWHGQAGLAAPVGAGRTGRFFLDLWKMHQTSIFFFPH